MKKKKLKSISKLKTEADNVFSKWIRERDNHKCYTCGVEMEWQKSQCGHFIQRDVMKLRYDEVNCKCQCYLCNVVKKGNYIIYTINMIRDYGKKLVDKYLEIYKNRHSDIKKYSRDFYENIIEKYGNNI